MPESSGKPKPSEIDAKQRHPFLLFCFSATAFAAVLVFGDRVPLSWREGMRLLTVMTGAFGLWNFCQLITLAGTNNQALRLGFLATPGSDRRFCSRFARDPKLPAEIHHLLAGKCNPKS